MKTKKEILEEVQLLNEDGIENTLMIAGFVPVIGEVADIALILYYCSKKQYLYAGLMLIALIPTVGDLIAKPLIRLLKGAGSAGKLALKNTDEMVKFANSNPAFKKEYMKLGKHLDSPLVNKTIEGVNKVSTNLGSKLQQSVSTHKSVLSKLLSRPTGIVKSIGKEVSAGGKMSTGLKQFFRDEKLAQHIAKKGMKPQTWISNWWNVVYRGGLARRNMVKNFIMSNKLLDLVGLPSIGTFEDKIQNDENFQNEMANNPTFSNIVNQTTTPEDLQKIEGNNQTQSKNSGLSGIEGAMGLALLKSLAKGIA